MLPHSASCARCSCLYPVAEENAECRNRIDVVRRERPAADSGQ